jgi:bifunctional UDP-N-acetylglucosamine pyrophosphorylase/glucosamine-1-phosphate N-acetyltransferase
MTDRPLAAVLLAAGQGKRMRAPGPKVLLEVCGAPLVEHVLDALAPLGARPLVVVHGHGGDAVKRALEGRGLRFAHQAEQRGTGHAVRCALPALDGFAGDVLVLCGDTPLLTTDVLAGLVADHRAHRRTLTVLSALVREPGSLGRVVRDPQGRFVDIREAADASPEELRLREINTGVLVADAAALGGALGGLTADNAQGEYYLTDVPRLLLADGLAVAAHRTDDEAAALGVNNPAELAAAARLLRERILARVLAAGVRVEDPATTVLDAGAEIGAGTVLRPFTHVAKGARVGKDCRIGPFAYLADGAVVGDGAALGAHVEVRRASIGAGARVDGGARVTDAAVGRGAVVGAGVVLAGSGDRRVVVGEGEHVGAGAGFPRSPSGVENA